MVINLHRQYGHKLGHKHTDSMDINLHRQYGHKLTQTVWS